MTPGAGNNIRPNQHQLASIKYENATKIDECLVVLKFPLVGTGTPWQGPVPLQEDRNSPRQGLVPLGGDCHYAMEDCWKTANLNMKIHKTYLDLEESLYPIVIQTSLGIQ